MNFISRFFYEIKLNRMRRKKDELLYLLGSDFASRRNFEILEKEVEILARSQKLYPKRLTGFIGYQYIKTPKQEDYFEPL